MKTKFTPAGFCLKAAFTLVLTTLWSITALAQPANDLCGNAIPITSSTTCTWTAGTVNNATFTGPVPGSCLGTQRYDVWYSFTAQSAHPVISLGSVGAGFLNPKIQVLSGTCGALTNVSCNTAAIIGSSSLNLNVGTTYFIRVFSTDNPVPTTNGDFQICVTDPPAPANDLCANATTLTSAFAPAITSGNLNHATVDAVASCSGAPRVDVWYNFVAQSVNPIIRVANQGSGFTNQRVELFSGTCGSMTSEFCGTPATLLAANLSLTIGTSYRIRVYSTTTTTPTANATFDISVADRPLNDLCANAITLTSGSSCSPVTGTVLNASPSTPAVPHNPATGTVRYDVWYRFVAQSINPAIQITNVGAGFIDPRIQIFSGDCSALTSMTGSTLANLNTAAINFVIGQTYYIRLFSITNPIPTVDGNFDICIVDPAPPVNDEPLGAIDLISGATCVNIQGNVGNSTFNSGDGTILCGGTPRYDIWYKFVAQRVNPVITISGVFSGTAFNTPRIQVFAGIPSSTNSLGCGGTSYNPQSYIIGQTYYIRVYSSSGTVMPNSFNGLFNICITDPALPTNDDCATAMLLVQNATCVNTTGNLGNAQPSASAIPGECGNPNSPDLWYQFEATSPYPQISLSGANASFMAAGLRLQLFSGTCGSLNSLICNSSSTNALTIYPPGAPLTPGQVYFIRVSSGAAYPAAGSQNFSLCVRNASNPEIHFGKTYVNVSKGTGGGTIEPGDILEMRAVLNVRSNVMFNASYNDIVPANTTYIPGTLKILTNEGVPYRSWSDAVDSDPASITGTNVHFNLGQTATSASGGNIRAGERPAAGGGTTIMVVSFRMSVNAVPFGTQIQMGGGTFNYLLPDGTPGVINYQPTPATVYPNYGICTNTIGSNGILSEFGGTFGTGTTKDRAASNKIPANYDYVPFSTANPGDYRYGISNNTSANSTTNYSINPAEPFPSPNRVFTHWDVIGDHTGAADPLAGNLPTDVNNNQTGGYMVVINASYRADTAFQDTVRNLCPNTSYEYSAWFRNICRTCGTDTNNVNYINLPSPPADVSGVKPNLTFNINGSDYYTTGDIQYTGQWIKKGFTYRTGPGETEMIINIRNNAPGGGGNDWAIDDIGVATCSPTLAMNPSTPSVNVCYGDGQSLSADVISYYDNFTHYIWERSVDSGATWTTTSFAGTASPTYSGTDYQYTATGPSFIGDSTTHNNQFRLRVASSATNLADINCSFRAVRTVVVRVHYCMYVLKTKVLNFSGSIQQSLGVLNWTTTSEEPGVTYTVERSIDGNNYKPIGTVNGRAATGFGDKYQFTDPAALKVPTYYRITVTENGKAQYTKVVLLSPVTMNFEIRNVLSPFDNQLSFDVIAPADATVKFSILDNFGRVVKTFNQQVSHGLTNVKTSQHGAIANGIYLLRAEYGNSIIIKRMVKVNK